MSLFGDIANVVGGVASVAFPEAAPFIGAGLGVLNSATAAGGAQQAAQATQVRPYSGTSGLGSITYDNNNRTFNLSAAPSPFTQLLNMLGPAALSNAAAAPSSPYWGAPQEVVNAANAFDTPAMTQAGVNRYNLLSQLAQPEYNRTFNNLQQHLFGMGQLGTSGGAEQMRAFYEAQNQADLQRQLAGQDWATQNALNRFNIAQNAVGSGTSLAQQNFNQGTASFQGINNLFSALGNLANTGVASGGGQNAQAAINAAQAQNAVPASLYAGLTSALGGLGSAAYTPESAQSVNARMVANLPPAYMSW